MDKSLAVLWCVRILNALHMLNFPLGMLDAAEAIDRAVAKVLDEGYRTHDFFQNLVGKKR